MFRAGGTTVTLPVPAFQTKRGRSCKPVRRNVQIRARPSHSSLVGTPNMPIGTLFACVAKTAALSNR